MIDILLLPFMCLSLAQEGAKAAGKPYSVNEITSCVDFNTKSSQTRRKISSSRTIIEEESSEHASYGRAQSIGTFGIQDEDIEVRGNESQFNKTDVYSFRVTDRIRAHFRFGIWGCEMLGHVYDEQGNELFEITDDDEKYGPTALFKKGIYFVVVSTGLSYNGSQEYSFYMWSELAKSEEKVTIDEEMMSKYKALVWESDYVPGGVKAVDGTVVKSGAKGRRTPWKYTGGFYSCNVDEEFLYRSIYIWSKDSFESMKKDIENVETAVKEARAKRDDLETAWNKVSLATGAIGWVLGFVPGGGTFAQALSTISLGSSLIAMSIGNGTKLKDGLIEKQCLRLKGSLEAASDGTIISIKESAAIRLFKDDDKYIKHHTYKLKFNPYVNQLNDTHCSVERIFPNLPYPTYDMWLHHGGEKEIVSDCQGTFKAYTNLADLKPLFKVE